MKKILKYAAVLAAILPVSCNKDLATPEVAPEARTVKVRVNATANDAIDSKVVLDGMQFKWVEGDQLKLRWANNILENYDDNNGCEIVSALGNGSCVAFEGEIRYAEESIYAYYSNNGFFHTTSSVMYCHDISEVQTGRIEDLKDYVAYYARIHKNNITFNKELNATTGSQEVVSIDFDANMSPAFALLKLNVPEDLALTKITLNASSKIFGRTYIQPHRTWGTFGDGTSFFHRPPASETCPQGNTITVYRDGEVISGDVYITLAIDKYDEETNNYCCSAESLSFTFTNLAGDFNYTKSLNEHIYLGAIKNLGSVPSTVMPAGTLCLSGGAGNGKESIKVSITAPNPGYKFYYEIASSMEKCPTPTASSAEFDLDNGIMPSISNSYDQYYIKVFADTDVEGLEDCYFEGYLRNWCFFRGCPTAEVLATWTEESEPVETTDGLYISNSKAGNINYTQYDNYMNVKTPFISINVVPEYASKMWLNFFVGDSKCGYKLNVGNKNSGVSTYNGYPTVHTMPGSPNCFTWYLGSVTPGLNLALRGDGAHNYYRVASLEVL